MNFNFKRAVEELKKNVEEQGNGFDCVDMEKCLREFKTELYIKRDEVKQLRNDLESANYELKDLKKAFDMVKKFYEEKTFNLNLLINKSGKQEMELLEKRESLMSLQLQHKMTIAENEVLQDKLQESELERLELTRKLENFEAKQRHDFIYHNAFLKRETNLRSAIREINEMLTKVKNEHNEIMELSKKTKFAEEAKEKFQELCKNYKRIKEEKENFEELYIKINAKYEKQQELMTMKGEIHEPNLTTKLIFHHWKTNRARYAQKSREMNEILEKVTESYTSEKTTNIQLIMRNEELTELLEKTDHDNQNLHREIKTLKESYLRKEEELKKKIEELEEKISQSGIREVIEIKHESVEFEN